MDVVMRPSAAQCVGMRLPRENVVSEG